ncbi:hypothetical protein Acor_34770 [Acrocarpospora corrugata]|uniref:FAD-binding PCMH-type domain-containing protein n=1 Tax=Acrocarpospora corrugata TaxID=35763 RepID=A0A5M3W279_9ACTN|nr:hypothetical protein [Acrocarpospora corrugata]GES01413.1 hypothetical protein Acor_34770 [Acrocarpospora corrugata]
MDHDSLRAEFPLLDTCLYLNSNSTGAVPRRVETVLKRYWQTLTGWRDEVWSNWLEVAVRGGGHVADVGVAGLTLGGGNGWFARVFGLACDNLLAADVLTAAGEIVRAGPDENQDLYWGLRGGGNLGVVLEFTLRLHPVGDLLGGLLMYRLEDAPEVLGFLAEYDAPDDEVNVAPAILAAPPAPFVPAELHGQPVFALAVCYVGDIPAGVRELAALRAVGKPLADLVGPTSFEVLQHFFDAQSAPTPYRMRSHLGGPITAELIETLVDFGGRPSSPENLILLLPMGGTTGAVAPEETAFWHRGAAYCLEIAAAWSADEENPGRHAEWADQLWAATRPWSVGAEANHLATKDLTGSAAPTAATTNGWPRSSGRGTRRTCSG